MKRVKLLSAWVGDRPAWYDLFAAQWNRFATVDWENIIPWLSWASGQQLEDEQLRWLNRRVHAGLGLASNKTGRMSLCDLRPAFGELFADRYAGYDWWGWCDVDILCGDLDRLLSPLLDGCDVLHFKKHYLSGCFALFRNCPETRALYRANDHYKAVFLDHRYHVWDESGYPEFGDKRFYDLVLASGLRVQFREDLMLYDSPSCGPEVLEVPLSSVELRGGQLLYETADGSGEALFYHFMSDRWPLGSKA